MTLFTLVLIAVVILAVIGLGWQTFSIAVLDGFDRALNVGIPIIKNLTQEAQAQAQNITEQILSSPPKEPLDLCGPDGINCYEFEFKGGNNLLVVEGDEFISNVAPGGPEFIKNPGFWEHVDELITLGFEIKSVLYVENEDVNSYRVIMTKGSIT